MKPVTLTIVLFLFALTICPQAWATGLQFFMNTTEQQLLCVMTTGDTDKSYIVDISITDFTEPMNKFILASASICQSDLYVHKDGNLSIEVNGSISQHQAKLDIRFNTENGCDTGNYLCEVTFRDSKDYLNRKHEIVEAKIPDLIRSKQADYPDEILSIQMRDLRDTLAETASLLSNRSDGFEERLVNLIKRVESFEQSSSLETWLPYKSHQLKQDPGHSYPAQVNTSDSNTNITEDTLSSEQAGKEPSASNLHLDVNPTTISPGLTDVLQINCSLNYGSLPDVAILISLTVFKAEMQNSQPQNFHELVSLSSFSGNQVNVMSQINSTIKGHVGMNEDSFLSLQWTDPTETERGHYRCIANVLNKFGRPNVIYSTTVQVKSTVPGLDDAFNKVNLLQSLLQDKEDRQTELEVLIKSQNEMIMSLESQLSQQNDTISILRSQSDEHDDPILNYEQMIHFFFERSHNYNGRYYLLSKQDFTNISISEAICEAYGGYLVELDDHDEHTFLGHFLNSFDYAKEVMVGATDKIKEGEWKHIHSGSGLVYTNWYQNNPTTHYYRNCMILRRSNSWLMEDWPCTSQDYRREKLVCEIPFK